MHMDRQCDVGGSLLVLGYTRAKHNRLELEEVNAIGLNRITTTL